MKKLSVLLASMFLLVSCAETMALLGPVSGASNGKMLQSSLNSAVSYGVKKKTGKTPMQHALAYAEEKNPNKKKRSVFLSLKNKFGSLHDCKKTNIFS